MRLAIFSATLPPYSCGVGKHTYFLANALGSSGQNVTVVTLESNDDSTRGNFQVDPSLEKFSFSQYIKWARLNKGKFDIVHLQYPTKLNRRGVSVVLLPWVLRWYGFKSTLTLHELSEASLLGKVRNIALATGFFRIILTNPQDTKFLPHKHKSIHHITLGPTLIPGKSGKADVKPPAVGFLGFMDGSKGEQDLISAVSQAKSKVFVYFLTKFDPQQNQHHANLKQLVESLDLSSMIEWVSPKDDQHILDYLQAVDIVVMPFTKGVTKRNSTLLEAIVAGKPVIVSDGGYLPEYLVDRQNCLMVKPQDSLELARALDLLVNDEELRQLLAQQAKELSVYFDWPTIANQTVSVYQS